MNKIKRMIVCILTLSLVLCMAGCKSSKGSFSHSTFKSAAKKCGAEVVEDATSFARIANQLYGYSVFISAKGDEAQSLFESQVTATGSLPEIKEFSIFMSTPDEDSFCYITMATFSEESDANEFYKTNCSQVKGNIIGNDGYSYNLKYSVEDGLIEQAGAYQKGKTVLFLMSGNPESKDFKDPETILQELGVKTPSSVAKNMPKN